MESLPGDESMAGMWERFAAAAGGELQIGPCKFLSLQRWQRCLHLGLARRIHFLIVQLSSGILNPKRGQVPIYIICPVCHQQPVAHDCSQRKDVALNRASRQERASATQRRISVGTVSPVQRTAGCAFFLAYFVFAAEAE